MSWTSMHFAVGMVGGAAVTATLACAWRGGLRYTPLGMTLGGLWAIVPDTPRLVRVDFPSLRSLPGATAFGDKATEAWLHQIGDVFFLHRAIDLHLPNMSLAGLFAVVALYTISLAGLLGLVARQRTRITRLQQSLDAQRSATEPIVERRRAAFDPPRGLTPGDPVPRRRRSDWQRVA